MLCSIHESTCEPRKILSGDLLLSKLWLVCQHQTLLHRHRIEKNVTKRASIFQMTILFMEFVKITWNFTVCSFQWWWWWFVGKWILLVLLPWRFNKVYKRNWNCLFFHYLKFQSLLRKKSEKFVCCTLPFTSLLQLQPQHRHHHHHHQLAS